MAGMTGIERMYGLGRVLADFYDALPPGTVMTADVQRQAQQVALTWLQERMPGIAEAPPTITPDQPAAANG